MDTHTIDLNEFEEHFTDWLKDLKDSDDYDLSDAVTMKLIKELGEMGIVQSFQWNDKDGFTLEMKPTWKDAINY